jgi:hypothetical protein
VFFSASMSSLSALIFAEPKLPLANEDRDHPNKTLDGPCRSRLCRFPTETSTRLAQGSSSTHAGSI